MQFGEWIKTSEQLPPEPDELHPKYYLATTENNHVVAVKYVKVKVRGQVVLRWEWQGSICHWDIIAWMAFPEAYKG